MTKEMREVGGCKFEKNSVNCPCKDGDNMPRKERDYKAEYAREKERGGKKSIHFTVNLSKEKGEAFDAKIALESLTDDGKKVTRNGLLNKWIDMYLTGQLN